MVLLTIFGPAVVGELIGVMVKSADVMAAPVELDEGAPVTEVEPAGVGIPDGVAVGAPLLVVVAAGTGVGPPVELFAGAELPDVVAAATGATPPVVEMTVDAPGVFVVAAAVGAGVTVTVGVPFTMDGPAAVLPDVLHAPGVE